MILNNKEEYNQWVSSHGRYLRKWPNLTKEQKWFVYANARQAPGPKISVETKPSSKMVWSVNRKV